jgi:hypothetical protein
VGAWVKTHMLDCDRKYPVFVRHGGVGDRAVIRWLGLGDGHGAWSMCLDGYVIYFGGPNIFAPSPPPVGWVLNTPSANLRIPKEVECGIPPNGNAGPAAPGTPALRYPVAFHIHECGQHQCVGAWVMSATRKHGKPTFRPQDSQVHAGISWNGLGSHVGHWHLSCRGNVGYLVESNARVPPVEGWTDLANINSHVNCAGHPPPELRSLPVLPSSPSALLAL